jgi:hypothetical protein
MTASRSRAVLSASVAIAAASALVAAVLVSGCDSDGATPDCSDGACGVFPDPAEAGADGSVDLADAQDDGG